MFKSILMPVDGSEHSEIALEYAIEFSKFYEAKINLLHVIDIRALEGPLMQDISASIGAIPYGNYQVQIREILEERADAILSQAEEKCKEADVGYKKKTNIGIVPKEICEEAHKVDLVVLGQRGEHARWATAILGSTLESVVRSCNKPILVTACQTVDNVDKILMAYDGENYANDALHVTANIATEMDLPMVVLTVASEEIGAQIIDEARDYLTPYELDVEYELVQGDSADKILEIAHEKECNLIAMGAYGEWRFKELILGSTTESVLRKTDLPLLLCR